MKNRLERTKKKISEKDYPPYSLLSNSGWAWGGILLILILTGLIRFRFLDVPLYRDEGEYAYMGQILLQGIPPYTEAYNMKFPGIYFFYALLLALFGETQIGIHLGLMAVNAATIILLFLLGRRLSGDMCGFIAGASFAVLTLSPTVEGFWANSEHLVVLPAIGGVLLLAKAADSGSRINFFLSGLLLGIASMIKQHGLFFLMFGTIFIVYHSLRQRPLTVRLFLKRTGLFLAGGVIPPGFILFYLFSTGVFDKFWFWTFTYAAGYASSTPLSTGMVNLKNSFVSIARPSFVIWILGAAGLGVLWRDKKLQTKRLFMTGFLVFSFLSTCPGFYFRSHYFILFLPAVALLAGIAMSALTQKLSSYRPVWVKTGLPVLLAGLSICSPLYAERNFLFRLSPIEACRELFGSNPFPESLAIAAYIKENTKEGDRIAVAGSEPQIYFYSHRRSATGYIYTYALMENQKNALQMQKDMIREIEQHQPQYIIFVNIAASWLISRDSEQLIFKWLPEYLKKYYEQDGIVDILSKDHTEYIWGSAARDYTPLTLSYLSIYRRKVEPAM